MTRGGVVWISEDVEFDDRGDRWCTGTFHAYHDPSDQRPGHDEIEGVSAEEAIAWGRQRANTVLIRAGEGRHFSAAGHRPPDAKPWPQGGPEPLVRRRVEWQRWKDRTDTDPPVEWMVTWAAAPPASIDLGAARDEVLAAARATVGHGVEVSAQSLDMWLADVAATRGKGFATYGSPVLDLTLRIDAPTAAAAIEASHPRIALPDGWRLGGPEAEPARTP